MPDPSPDAPSEPAGPVSRGPGFVVAVSLAVLFAILAAVLAVVAVRDTGSGDLDELRRTAGRFGEVLVTYDYNDPNAHRDAVLDLATGSFRQEYEDAFDQGLEQVITEVEAVSTGTVNDVYLSSVDDGQAQAVVSVDIEVSGVGGDRSITDQYVLLTLIRVEDAWKVDQVTDLSLPTSGSPTGRAPSDTTASTTTSIP
jgi:hypothetical protein